MDRASALQSWSSTALYKGLFKQLLVIVPDVYNSGLIFWYF